MVNSNLAEDISPAWTLEGYLQAAGIPDVPAILKGIKMPDMMFGEPFHIMPHQITALNGALLKGKFGLLDECGCVSGDTEYLSPTGWKRIDQYEEGVLVCQYDIETDTASFCRPFRYVKERAPYLVSIKGSRGTDQLLSPDHKVLVKVNLANKARDDRRGLGDRTYWKTMLAESLLDDGYKIDRRIPTVFNLPMEGKEFLTDDQLRIMVAVIADGYFPNNCNTVILRLKKERKLTRIKELLDKAEIPYTCRPCLPEGFFRVSFSAPRREKKFGSDYWGISSKQRTVVFEEFPHWDGSKAVNGRGSSFCSTSKESSDFIQFVIATQGIASSLSKSDRPDKGNATYDVKSRGTQSPYVMPRKENITKIEGEADVYCFTVPKGYLVLRRNGYIFVTGNCGKTLPAMGFMLANAAFGNKCIAIMPPVLLAQLRDAFEVFFPGVADRFNIHTLTASPLPIKIGKKKAQLVLRDYHTKISKEVTLREQKIPESLYQTCIKMKRLEDVPFLPKEVQAIRALAPGEMSMSRIAELYGCSIGAVSAIRKCNSLEDLFDGWNASGFPDILLLSAARYLGVADRLVKHYRAMVIDECHLLGISNSTSKLYKKVKTFVKYNDAENGGAGLLCMSGTPASNNIADLYGIISLTNPRAYTDNQAFRKIHLDTVEFRKESADGRSYQFETIIGYKELGLLNHNLYVNSRRLRVEQLFPLDKPHIIRSRIILGQEHLKAYKKIIKEMVIATEEMVLDFSSQQRLRMMAAQMAVVPEVVDPDFKAENTVREWLMTLLESLGIGHGEKIVIFAHFIATIDHVRKNWLKEYDVAVVNSTANTTEEVAKFLSDSNCSVMIAHPRSGGTGLNLQGVCRYIAFLEPTSIPGSFIQACGRVHRKGQKKVVSIYLPEVVETVLPKRIDTMLGRFKVNEEVQGDKSTMLKELLGE
jgi:hypothetical protein